MSAAAEFSAGTAGEAVRPVHTRMNTGSGHGRLTAYVHKDDTCRVYQRARFTREEPVHGNTWSEAVGAAQARHGDAAACGVCWR